MVITTISARSVLVCGLVALVSCAEEAPVGPRLHWYVFDEQSGVFEETARRCSEESNGRYEILMAPLPTDANQQREQLVRRLAARDEHIDIIGMDVIWTAELAAAGWILPWVGEPGRKAKEGRLGSAVESASYDDRLWAAPYTANTQLLWYRTDRVAAPPTTWDEMIETAEGLGGLGTIQAQGERYEGLTVFFVSLLASAGGSVLAQDGESVSLEAEPTRRALEVMQRLARSPATDSALSTAREDQGRLAFESGGSSFMLNYTYVWPSARANVPELAPHIGWARWPAVIEGRPSRVTLGGINVGIGAYTRLPELAFEAAVCIASTPSQRLAAERGGLPPTIEALYDDAAVREVFPFAEVLRGTLRDAVQRPQTPLYADVSLAISHTLHPMGKIDPVEDTERLREAVERALHSEGLL